MSVSVPSAPRQPVRRRAALRSAVLALAAGLVAGTVSATASPAAAANPPTVTDFTGYGFDQCVAPTQAAMDAWLRGSPYWAVGIYISGDSRGCRTQPNLTPAWVRTQLAHRWRLLPITLGPQASCSTRYPRYGDDETIRPASRRNYRPARLQGRAEAARTVAEAKRLGIVPRSTLWYDLEAFDSRRTRCRESAIRFLHGWTNRLHELGYVSGVYSSAASGIRMLDDVRVTTGHGISLPDRIWVGDWNGRADTASSYIRSDGWLPGGRVHQYRGGHPETWGGVTINVDSNWLDLGRGSTPGTRPVHCGGVRVGFRSYPLLDQGATGPRVKAAQCLLEEQGFGSGAVDGRYDAAVVAAVRAFRAAHGFADRPYLSTRPWMALHAAGPRPLVKYGAASDGVRRLQRALNAHGGYRLEATGTFEGETTAAVKAYQKALGAAPTGVVTPGLWRRLQAGRLG